MSQPFSAHRLLLPLVPLYRLALAFRELLLLVAPARRLRFPVVSVGNLSTGGAGKTPLAIALAQALGARGQRVDVLSRGYGRQSKLAARVLPDGSAEAAADRPRDRRAGLCGSPALRRRRAGRGGGAGG
jgi:tetraacyldisaccharide 4'-kinase